ncbi:MAG: hypothetical protein JNL25_10905, partial [Rhodospirillaceae bacterium]|nr:hypothetical protein [Rhodospirillaceae bacterium]
GGDRDYDDVVISVDIGQYNINMLSQTVTQPTVTLSDADSSHLASVIITTKGFDPSDSLNLPTDSRFDVTTEQHGADFIFTITAKSGAEPVADFESFLNHTFFSTSDTVEGDRMISYQAIDTDANVSNIETIAISVTVTHEDIVAQQSDFGAGDDTLHLNAQVLGQAFDLGVGHDTAHLDQHGMAFGSAEAQHLRNVEVIDARAASHNDITLSFDDVIDMTDDTHHLTILGHAGDALNLTGDGVHNWSVVDQGADFTTYAYSDGINQAMVEVSNQMAQTIV